MREQPLGPGISVQGFDSMEEMLAYQAEQERIATQTAMAEQWEISYGDYVFRIIDNLQIFGEIFTRESFLGPAPDKELVDEWVELTEAYERGYRYGRWYSKVVPEGEYGSAHVVTLWKITERDFERARMLGWEVWSELAIRMSQEILRGRTKQNETKEGE